MEEKKTRPGRNGGTLLSGGASNAGRKRLLFKDFNAECKAFGISPISRSDFSDAALQLLQLTLSEMEELSSNEDAPMALRILSKSLLSGGAEKTLWEILRSEWGQKFDVTSGGEKINTWFERLALDDRLAVIELYNKANALQGDTNTATNTADQSANLSTPNP